MNIFNPADDNDYFTMNPDGSGGEGSGGNLQNLFGMNARMDQGKSQSQSLTYTAPKKPTKQSENATKPEAKKPAPGGVFAAVITAYRFVNGKNEKVGKIGCAVLKNIPKREFTILLYVSKQQPVATAAITPAFSLTIQRNNCGGFYDNKRQFWNILFENEDKLNDFSKQVALCKFYSASTSANLVTLDMTAKSAGQDQPTISPGDNAEVKYTGWLVDPATVSLGKIFDSNVSKEKMFRFKAGQGKVIKGWDSGMLGMEKGMNRFLVIPSHLAYGERGMGQLIPPNSTLAFQVELIRMKQSSREKSSSFSSTGQQSANEQPQPSEKQEQMEKQTHDVMVTHSPPYENVQPIQQLSTLNAPQVPKAAAGGTGDVMSRIANVGMPMFPIVQSESSAKMATIQTSQQHDVQPNILYKQQEMMQHQQKQQELLQHQQKQQELLQHQQKQQELLQHQQKQQELLQQQMLQQQQLRQYEGGSFEKYHQEPRLNPTPMHSSVPPTITSSPQYHTIYGGADHQKFQPHTVHSATLSSEKPMGGPDMIPVLVMESKQQNSELRLIQHKLDHVSLMLHEVKKDVRDSPAFSNRTSDSALESRNTPGVHKLLKENEMLEKLVAEKTSEVETHKETIDQLLQKAKKNDTAKATDSVDRERIVNLERENKKLKFQLEESNAQKNEYLSKITDVNEMKRKLRDTYANEKQRADNAEKKLVEMQQVFQSLENEVQELRSNEISATTNHKKVKQLKDENKKLILEHQEKEEKWASEKSQLEQDHMDLKMVHEEAGNICKEAQEKMTMLRRRVAQLEADLEHFSSNSQSEALREKLNSMRSVCENQKIELKEYQDKVQAYKERHDVLRSRAAEMKSRYTEEIGKLQALLQKKSASSSTPHSKELTNEVKRIMNDVFQAIRGEVVGDNRYFGREVLEIALRVIKSCTFNMLNEQTSGENKEKQPRQQQLFNGNYDAEKRNNYPSSESDSSLNMTKDKSVNEKKRNKVVTFSSDVPISSGNPDKINTDGSNGEGVIASQSESAPKDDAATHKAEEIIETKNETTQVVTAVPTEEARTEEKEKQVEEADRTEIKDEKEEEVQVNKDEKEEDTPIENVVETSSDTKLKEIIASSLAESKGEPLDRDEPPPLPPMNDQNGEQADSDWVGKMESLY